LNSSSDIINQLLERVQNADKIAFSELYELVSPRLFGIQLRILKDQAIAEEALQETFIKVWTNAAQYDRNAGSGSVWLNSLARNQALDMLRRSRTRANVNVLLPDLNPDTWKSLGRPVIDELADIESLSKCLNRLEDEAQQCIVGVYCEGFTQDELSKTLERPLGTVKSWIRRGLISLKECLHELS
jgi:RNA polymerase sigma-70 factor (ECF subfamily)